MYEETTEKLLKFISKSPTAFQAAEETRRRFLEEGFAELKEEESWNLEKGGKYFVMRNHSAIIGFSIPVNDCRRYHIIASHSDSPSFKIKENPEMSVNGASVAGRMIVHKNGKILEKLVDIDRDLVMIPSLAIHMNRDINGGYHYNVQKDMLPLYSGSGEKGNFMRMLAEEAEIRPEDILGHDLFLYNRMPGTIWGSRNEFVSSPRLDDLQCAFASMEGFLQADKKKVIAVHCVLDNEEVGSTTRQGAASTFLKDVLFRINLALGGDQESYLMALAESFMISADNAHALHPNYTDKADPVNRPVMNGGIVIKYNANQKYCTDGISTAIFKELCREADVPYQTFVNRSDIAGGSTLGNISNTQAAINTVDIGLPQLAMHSAYETAGVKDTESLIRAAKVFYR